MAEREEGRERERGGEGRKAKRRWNEGGRLENRGMEKKQRVYGTSVLDSHNPHALPAGSFVPLRPFPGFLLQADSLSSFEPFLFYTETAPYGEHTDAFSVRLQPPWTRRSRLAPLQRRESTPVKSWKERQRVQGRGESSAGGGIIKEERFTTLVWNSYALRTYHCLRSGGFKEPLPPPPPPHSLSLFLSLTTSPSSFYRYQPFLSPSCTLLSQRALPDNRKGRGAPMVRTRDILRRRNRTFFVRRSALLDVL